MAYLIGPSGVGKSTLARKASELSNPVSHVDLDTMMRSKDPRLFFHNGSRWQDFWELARNCFRELEGQYVKGLCLVDCGAGCLKTEDALSYFEASKYVVVIYDSPRNAFNRASARPGGYWNNKPFEQYVIEEYSEKRKRFYEAAKYKVDITDLQEGESTEQFLHLVAPALVR